MDHPRSIPATFAFATPPRVLIVESRFHTDIADLLLTGARAVLERVRATVEVVTVPGALEIPAAILFADQGAKGGYDCYVALGCVIRGATQHDTIVGGESARGLQVLALERGLAIGNGILTCATQAQALDRADPAHFDRGGAAAEACLRLLEIKQRLSGVTALPSRVG